MMKLAVLLCLAPALASAADTVWAGIPLDTLAPLGLGAPSIDVRGDAWRAGLPDDGFVRLAVFADADAARADFARAAQSASSRALPALPGVGDEAAGDGAQVVLVRDANVVLQVVDPTGSASAWTDRLRASLVTSCAGTWEAPPLAGERDRCGRKR